MSNKKFNIITSNEEVAVLTSKAVSNKFILNAYNSYEYESGVNSLIFNLTSNEANISLYDEDTNINNRMIELNNNEININSNIWLRNSINSCNINLYGNLLITGNVNDIKSEEINYLSGLTKNISNNFLETSNYLDLNEINKENTSNHLNLLDYKINSNLVETYNIIENSNINISNYILNIESKTSNIEVIENGNIKLNSDLVINGKISTDIISSDDNNIIFTKSIIPSVNNLLDLGTPEYKFRDLYVGNNSLWIGDGASLSASEEGSMKVKKRKKGVPSIIENLTPQPSDVDNHLDGVKYYNPNQGISSLNDVKIHHWIKYYETLTGLENLTANDLFGNDTEEVSATDGWIDSNNNLILNSTEYQKIGIGTNNPNVILDITSTNAIKLPVGNNNERPNTTGIDNLGYIRYNNEEQCFEGYENYGSEYRWQHIGGVRDRDKDTYITAENCGHEHDEYIDTDVLSFYTDGEKRMTISKTGNVGIGNNFIAANKDLEVSGDVDINGTLYTQHLIVSGTSTEINTTYNNTSSINIENNGTDTTLLVKQTGEKNILETYYNDFNTFIIKNNCNIGISFDNPEYKLDINGGDFNIRDGNIRINCEELSTNHLIEGNVNLFYTTDRFNVAFDNKLQSITTADNNPLLLTLQTGETTIVADEPIVQMHFQVPDEASGTDAILVCAGIEAVSEGDFAADNNATKLSFKTAASAAAAETSTDTSPRSEPNLCTLQPLLCSFGFTYRSSATCASVVAALEEYTPPRGLVVGDGGWAAVEIDLPGAPAFTARNTTVPRLASVRVAGGGTSTFNASELPVRLLHVRARTSGAMSAVVGVPFELHLVGNGLSQHDTVRFALSNGGHDVVDACAPLHALFMSANVPLQSGVVADDGTSAVVSVPFHTSPVNGTAVLCYQWGSLTATGPGFIAMPAIAEPTVSIDVLGVMHVSPSVAVRGRATTFHLVGFGMAPGDALWWVPLGSLCGTPPTPFTLDAGGITSTRMGHANAVGTFDAMPAHSGQVVLCYRFAGHAATLVENSTVQVVSVHGWTAGSLDSAFAIIGVPKTWQLNTTGSGPADLAFFVPVGSMCDASGAQTVPTLCLRGPQRCLRQKTR